MYRKLSKNVYGKVNWEIIVLRVFLHTQLISCYTFLPLLLFFFFFTVHILLDLDGINSSYIKLYAVFFTFKQNYFKKQVLKFT